MNDNIVMSNLIIYDFDDTLFPSYSYVNHTIIFNDEVFNEIDNIMFELLEYSLSIAKVKIISDGDIGWLFEILGHLPKTFELIHNQMEIVSTVNYYSHLFRKNVNEYKLNYILENINIREYDNIINIGDGKNELYATTSINEIFGNKIKHIQLIYESSYDKWKYQMLKMKEFIEIMLSTNETFLTFKSIIS